MKDNPANHRSASPQVDGRIDGPSAVESYHRQSKHDFHRFAPSLGFLDWSTQPDPFRRFEGAELIRLGRVHPADAGPMLDDLLTPGSVGSTAIHAESVASFFFFSLALSAWKQFRGERWALRINPSSGNLHPTEGYLVAGPIDGLVSQPGVFHYAPKEHSLERRAEFPLETWNALVAEFPPQTMILGLTSIHWREAWKYGVRAFRYCQHDVGHAVAALSYSAAMLGWRTVPLDHLSDEDVRTLLGIGRAEDFDAAECEHPDLLLALIPRWAQEKTTIPRNLPRAALNAIVKGTWFGRANRLSKDHVEWPAIDMVSKACEKFAPSPSDGEAFEVRKSAEPGVNPLVERDEQSTPRAVRSSDGPAAPAQEKWNGFDSTPPPRRDNGAGQGARRIITQRRSAVAFDGTTTISANTFFVMLDRTLPRFAVPPWTAIGPPVWMHLALFVHRVDGLIPGLYFLVRNLKAKNSLQESMNPKFAWEPAEGCPPHLPLFMLASGDLRQMAATLSCHQEIAGDSAFSLGMIAEFNAALKLHGAWGYRRLFWEAGMIGQVLYLEAEAAGVRGTGIGCYFDDPVHRLLGLSDTSFQSLYHFTVGGAVEDSRLTTLPPYVS